MQWAFKLDNYKNFEYRINYALKNAMNKEISPMSYTTLKDNYKNLYLLLQKRRNRKTKMIIWKINENIGIPNDILGNTVNL